MGALRMVAHGMVRVRPNLSFDHLRNAAYLASTCRPLERDHAWPATEAILAAHGAAATSAIILSACSIEAAADEIRLTAKDKSEVQLGLLARGADRIARKWADAKEQRPLRQYQWLLEQAKLPKIRSKEPTFKAVDDLFDLRNGLVHWKAEWSNDAKRNDGLEKRLSGKFALNALSMPDQVFIPYRACGYGAASWAVRSVLAFLVAFGERIEARLPVPQRASMIEAFLAESTPRA